MKKIINFNKTLLVLLALLIAGTIYNILREQAYKKGRHETVLFIEADDDNVILLMDLIASNDSGDTLQLYGKDELEPLFSGLSGADARGYVRVPQKIDITWFSYNDNKFYKGVCVLPATKMEALADTKKDYSLTVMTMSNGMFKIIFDNNYNTPIARYKAKEINHKWPFKEDRQTEVTATLLQEHVTPVFLKKSTSKFNQLGYTVYHRNSSFMTGIGYDNQKMLQLVNNRINDSLPPGIPEYLSIGTNIDSTESHRHSFYTFFDVKEMVSLYNALKEKENDFTLQVHLTKKDSLNAIYLENKGKKLRVKNFKIDYRDY